MVLKLLEHKKGAQSIVIIDKQNNLAYKVFKSYKHDDNSDEKDLFKNEDVFNNWKRQIFESELEAYEKISQSSINDYFPKYYKHEPIDKIVDSYGQDISHFYLLDCVLTLELIPGECYKHNEMRCKCWELGVDLKKIFSELDKIGVKFYEDSSVFCSDKKVKIIDIATNDFNDFQPPL